MSNVPYIGCGIRLISKSDIRYEGTLFAIDTKESTVALQNVRSFGSEGRRKDGPEIPPSNNVYEYIIFRGSDIKQLEVLEPPFPQRPPQHIPDDPAIIHTGPPPPRGENSGIFPHPSPYPPMMMPPYYGYHPAYAAMYAAYGGFAGRGGPQQPPVQFPGPKEPLLPTPGSEKEKESKAGPAGSVLSHASISPEVGASVESIRKEEENAKRSEKAAFEESKAPKIISGEEQETKGEDGAIDGNVVGGIRGRRERGPQQHHEPRQSGDRAPRGRGMGRGRGQHHNQHHNPQQRYNSNPNRGGRRVGPGPQQHRPQQSQQERQQQREEREKERKEALASDFDFEKANALFDKDSVKEELKRAYKEDSDEEASSDAVAEGEGATASNRVPPDEGPVVPKAYDKSSSFFDSLSCETLDRLRENEQEAPSGGRGYAEQRRVDAETFGATSVHDRGHRGRRFHNNTGNRRQGGQGDRSSGNTNGGRRTGGYSSGGGYQRRDGGGTKRVFMPVNSGKDGSGNGEANGVRESST